MPLTNAHGYPGQQLVSLYEPYEATALPWWWHPVEEEDNGGWQMWVRCQDAVQMD